jgi:2-polyprenyl-6-methoxyphenol hydroxylase-like FAD-dependent oxidoreductase
MPDRRRVLIVGGGIAGLALAPMLARTGIAVEVIERERGWHDAGSSKSTSPSCGQPSGRASRYIGPSCTRSCGKRRVACPSAPDWPSRASRGGIVSVAFSDGTRGEYEHGGPLAAS